MKSTSFTKDMKSRHLIAITLGGVIDTGIIMSPGYFIKQAGAIGTILAYVLGAILTIMVMMCLGELSVHQPLTGAFHVYANEYIGRSVGFVVAWLYWFSWTVCIGADLISIVILVRRWWPGVSEWGLSLGLCLVILLLNVTNLKWFTSSEEWLSSVKVIVLLAFILAGIGMTLKLLPVRHVDVLPDFGELTVNGWFPHGLRPILATVLTANFAFSGTEMIGIAAGESKNPQKSVPKAIRETLLILIVLFIGTIVMIGTNLSPKSPALATSPVVAVLDNLGIPDAGGLINGVLIVTLFSAADSSVYAASRMIWSLANQHELPKPLAKLNRRGLPTWGLVMTIAGGLLSLFSSIFAAKTVYVGLTALSAFAVIIVWIAIGWAQLSFRKRFLKRGHHSSELKYRVPWYPLIPWLVIILCVVSIIGCGFDPKQRIALVVGIPFTLVLYFGDLIWQKSKGNK